MEHVLVIVQTTPIDHRKCVLCRWLDECVLTSTINLSYRVGVIQPSRIGPDGKPEPVEHILQLTEHIANLTPNPTNPPNNPNNQENQEGAQ